MLGVNPGKPGFLAEVDVPATWNRGLGGTAAASWCRACGPARPHHVLREPGASSGWPTPPRSRLAGPTTKT